MLNPKSPLPVLELGTGIIAGKPVHAREVPPAGIVVADHPAGFRSEPEVPPAILRHGDDDGVLAIHGGVSTPSRTVVTYNSQIARGPPVISLFVLEDPVGR